MEIGKLILTLFILVLLIVTGCKTQPADSVVNTEIKEFDTNINGYNYNPSSITVNFRDIVRINIKNNDETSHGISLPSFGIQEFVGPGETKTIQFTANAITETETFCSTSHGEKLLINVV